MYLSFATLLSILSIIFSVVLTPTSELIKTSSRLSNTSSSTLLFPTITFEILLKKDSLLFFKPLSRDSFFSFVNSFLKKFILKKFNQRYIKQKKPLKSDFEYIALKIFT